MSFQDYEVGSYPKDELNNQVDQSMVTTTGRCIVTHLAVATLSHCGMYAQGSNLIEGSRVEIGDLLFRYKVGEDSTMDGDPCVLFRSLNGMDGGIKVVPAGKHTPPPLLLRLSRAYYPLAFLFPASYVSLYVIPLIIFTHIHTI